jgi:hypothetical protein
MSRDMSSRKLTELISTHVSSNGFACAQEMSTGVKSPAQHTVAPVTPPPKPTLPREVPRARSGACLLHDLLHCLLHAPAPPRATAVLKAAVLCSRPLEARNLVPCMYFRQSLAQALAVPLEHMVRVGTMHGAGRDASLEGALHKHACASAEKAAAADGQGGAPAKRARRSASPPREHENTPKTSFSQFLTSWFFKSSTPQASQSPGASANSEFPPFWMSGACGSAVRAAHTLVATVWFRCCGSATRNRKKNEIVLRGIESWNSVLKNRNERP